MIPACITFHVIPAVNVVSPVTSRVSSNVTVPASTLIASTFVPVQLIYNPLAPAVPAPVSCSIASKLDVELMLPVEWIVTQSAPATRSPVCSTSKQAPSPDTHVAAEATLIAIPATFVPILRSIAFPVAAADAYVISKQFPVYIPE